MSFPTRQPSGSVRSGPGSPAARPAGAEPRPLSSILGSILGQTVESHAERAFLDARPDQLQRVARRMVELDRDKALASAAALLFAVNGKDPELGPIRLRDAGWLLSASREAVEEYAAACVAVSPTVAGWLAAHLETRLSEADRRTVERRPQG